MTSTSTRSTPDSRPARIQRLLRASRSRLPFIIPVVVYVILSLLGITTSSIGIDFLREDPAAPIGTQLGAPQATRGDEYATESPLWLGQMARSGDEAITPLSVSDDLFAQLPVGPISSIVFFDGTAMATGSWIPHEILFAAKWWLPSLMLFLGMPILFRQLTGVLRWGYLASFLIFFAPATVWWSGRPVNTLGFTAAGCALAIYGANALASRSWARGVLAVAGAGILLARLPTYYQPLAIVIGVPLVAATAAYLLFQSRPWRTRIIGLGAIGVSGLFWTGLLFWENLDTVVAGLDTVYPGDRQSTGRALDPGMLFGATNLSDLHRLAAIQPVNQPELVTSFTILAVVSMVLLVSRPWSAEKPLRVVFWVISGSTLFWLSWAMVDWGSVGAALPLINRVPDQRAAQGVGYLATIAFCLLMSRWPAPKRLLVPVVAGLTAAGLSAYGGSWLQNDELPGLSTMAIWVTALVTGLVVFALIRWPQRIWTIVFAVVGAASLSIGSWPALIGLGDLRNSSTAQQFLEWGAASRAAGEYWASESQFLDALMMATGTPALSTRQQVGPDREAWEMLDETGAHEEMWNRGGLHVQFEWTSDEDITFEQPYPDVVIVQTSPCTLAEQFPGFRYAVTDDVLTDSCVRLVDEVEWSGSDFLVYEVDGS